MVGPMDASRSSLYIRNPGTEQLERPRLDDDSQVETPQRADESEADAPHLDLDNQVDVDLQTPAPVTDTTIARIAPAQLPPPPEDVLEQIDADITSLASRLDLPGTTTSNTTESVGEVFRERDDGSRDLAFEQEIEQFLAQELGEEITLSPAQREAIGNLSEPEKQMFRATLNEIKRLKDGEINGSQYMFNVMRHAAEIAGNDREQFVSLVGAAFSAPSTGMVPEGIGEGTPLPITMARGALSATPHVMGSVTELVFNWFANDSSQHTENGGYNSAIVDTHDKGSSVTHHFGELFQSGFSRGESIGHFSQLLNDTPSANIGDFQNGYFAVMLGSALSNESISPADAIKLTEWAYSQSSNDPWQQPGVDFTSADAYDISNWIQVYNQAHPDSQI